MADRKFEKGSFAKFNTYTPSTLKDKWNPTLDDGGYIQVTSVNTPHSYYSTYTVQYVFTLFDRNGRRKDTTTKTARSFDVGEKVTPKKVTGKEELIAQRLQLEKQLVEAHKVVGKIQQAIRAVDSKLTFLASQGLEDFDEKEYQAYELLRIMEEQPNLSRMAKAKLIARIVT